jgi:hypothetical protein
MSSPNTGNEPAAVANMPVYLTNMMRKTVSLRIVVVEVQEATQAQRSFWR